MAIVGPSPSQASSGSPASTGCSPADATVSARGAARRPGGGRAGARPGGGDPLAQLGSPSEPITWPTTRPSRERKNVSGRPVTPQARDVALPGSRTWGKVSPNSAMKSRASSRGVLGVEAEEQRVAAASRVQPAGALRLGTAGVAPGGPEVEDQRRAAQLVERDLAVGGRAPRRRAPDGAAVGEPREVEAGGATASPRESASSIVRSVALVVSP